MIGEIYEIGNDLDREKRMRMGKRGNNSLRRLKKMRRELFPVGDGDNGVVSILEMHEQRTPKTLNPRRLSLSSHRLALIGWLRDDCDSESGYQ